MGCFTGRFKLQELEPGEGADEEELLARLSGWNSEVRGSGGYG